MATKVSIFNDALGMLGQGLVDSDTDPSENVYILNGHWLSVVDICHEKTAWDFAKVLAQLPQAKATPVFGYQYYYAFPADCIRPLRYSQSGKPGDDLILYEADSKGVATDATVVYMSYISDNSATTVGNWSASFAHMVAAELAMRAAAKINPAAADAIAKERKKATSDAISLDASEGPPVQRPLGSWSRSARGIRSGGYGYNGGEQS